LGRRFTTTLLSVCALGLSVAGPCAAQRAEARKVDDAVAVFQALTSIPDRQVPRQLMKTIYGLGIFPDVQKASFVIGGQRGRGLLMTRGRDGTWSLPLFITLTGASVGWQVGIQSSDIVLFFRTRQSVESILSGKYTLGVAASLAAGSLGREAAAATDADMKAEIYSYSRSRGIFAGVSVQGVSLEVDLDSSSDYYGRNITRPSDVLGGGGLPEPASAARLRKAVSSWEKSIE
jgi:lipid-binding SYLF domain-containing protein